MRRAPSGDTWWGGEEGHQDGKSAPAWPRSRGGEKSTPGVIRNMRGLSLPWETQHGHHTSLLWEQLSVCFRKAGSCQGRSRPRGWGLRPLWAQLPTCAMQITAPPTARIPRRVQSGEEPRGLGTQVAAWAITAGGPGAQEPLQQCSAPSSTSAVVY